MKKQFVKIFNNFVSFGKYNDDAFVSLFREAGVEIDKKRKPSSRISYLD